MYPLQTIAVAVLLLAGYFTIKNMGTDFITKKDNSKRRREALRQAKIYLAPYNNIWQNLRLSNKFCTLRLGSDGLSITARDYLNRKRYFKVVRSRVHPIPDLWDMFCVSFDHNTTFDGLIQMCSTFNVDISVQDPTVHRDNPEILHTESYKEKKEEPEKEKLDINNASEVELTALPGVSIVMAKKLIKKRDEIGGFKSVQDVCLFLRLKPHMQTQLEQLICVKKLKGSGKIKRYNERSIDL